MILRCSCAFTTTPRPSSSPFPYTTLFRSLAGRLLATGAEPALTQLGAGGQPGRGHAPGPGRHPIADPGRVVEKTGQRGPDRKSTRLNSSHVASSYAVFCLQK